MWLSDNFVRVRMDSIEIDSASSSSTFQAVSDTREALAGCAGND